MNSAHTARKTTHFPKWSGERPCPLRHPQEQRRNFCPDASKAHAPPPSKSQSYFRGLPVSAPLSPTPPITSLTSPPRISPPEPFWLHQPPPVPLKDWELWNIPHQGLSIGHYLHGWPSVVTFAGRPCSDHAVENWALPSRPVPPPCFISIHSTHLYPTHSVVYLFILFLFFPCPHQNGSTSEAGTSVCFDHRGTPKHWECRLSHSKNSGQIEHGTPVRYWI